jgi:hypothetical protein
VANGAVPVQGGAMGIYIGGSAIVLILVILLLILLF